MGLNKKAKLGTVLLLTVALLLSAFSAAASAEVTSKVKVGSVTLSDDQCLVSNSATSATDGNNGGNYVAYFKDNTLYLNNLTISNGQIYLDKNNSDLDTTIHLTGANSVTNASGSAILAELGWVTGRGMSVTFTGSGSLTVTGKNDGMWIWKNITFKDSVKVTATGTTQSGIRNNSDVGTITVADNAQVVASGAVYGVGYDNRNSDSTVNITGGTLTAVGGTSAFRKAPSLGIGVTMQVSRSPSGANPEGYNSANNAIYYKWAKTTYTTPTWTVTYLADGNTVATVPVEHGKDATAPAVPEKTGHTGAWDNDGKNITGNIEIQAVYTPIKYSVTYFADSSIVDILQVPYGTDATAPSIPAKPGFTAQWDNDGKNITGNIEIHAVYTPIPAVPSTGDAFSALYIVALAVSAAAAILLIKQKRNDQA